MTEDSLRQICLQEIPLSFYKGLAEGSDSVYKEADADGEVHREFRRVRALHSSHVP